MKHALPYLICMLIPLVTVSCDLRDLTYGYYALCNLKLVVNWDLFGEIPSGMTAIFYPHDKNMDPIVYMTHSVSGTVVSLSKGTYDILLFNQSPGEFGTLNFRGLNRYETAEVYLLQSDRTDDMSFQPEDLAVATMENFEVTDEMIDETRLILSENGSGKDDVLTSTSIVLTPKCVVTPGKVIMHIGGLHNLYSLESSISGVASNFLPSTYASGGRETAHQLGPWKKQQGQNGLEQGVIECSFYSFGHPYMSLTRPEGVVLTKDSASEWGEASINLTMLLVDNETMVDCSFKVGDHVRKVEEDGRLKLIIEIADKIELPETEPADDGWAGFGASVDDWGEEESVKTMF